MSAPSPALLLAARLAIALVIAAEAAFLCLFLLAPRGKAPRLGPLPLWTWPLVLAVLFAVPAGLLARSGALAPGVSGAGMPWEAVTDDTPYAATAAAGARAYANRCAPCHLPDGRGLPPAYPPLLGSAFLAGDKSAHARIALFGSDGHPAPHASTARMPAFAEAASDAELAAILTYERQAFGGGDHDSSSAHVRPTDVAAARAAGVRP